MDNGCGGSVFQTARAATLKLRRPSCVLVEGTSVSLRSAEQRFARPEKKKCRRLGCRRCWSEQDSAHGHSQTQRLLFWTVFAVALGPNEACREEPVRCVRICQRDKRYHKLTGLPGTDADSCCCGSLSMRSCCRHSDIIDAVGRQVFKQVGVDRCRDGQVNVLPSSGVVIIQLIAGDWVRADCVRGSPLQLYRRRRHRFTTQITRLLRHYKQHNSLPIFR